MDPKTGWASNQTVCRCCLAEGCYKDISTEYFWMGKREVYSEMLSDTFDISISFPTVSSTTTSRLICEPCISRLRDASEFKKQVQDCEKTFVQHLDTVETGIELDVREPDPIPLMEPVLKVVKIEQVKMEKAESDDEYVPSADDMDDDHLNDDDDDDLDDEPLTKLASKKTKTPKTEPEPEPKASKRKITIKLKEPAKKPKVAAKIVSKAKPKPTTSKVLAKPQSDKKSKGSKKKKSEADKAKRNTKCRPLFQVSYDRTLCQPLGTVLGFADPDFILKSRSRSPSVASNGRHSPFEGPTTSNLETVVVQQEQKTTEGRENALAVFEHTSVYPFIYGNNKFKCFVCSQPFLDAALLSQHMNSHSFISIKRLLKNRRIDILKVDVSLIACKICSLQSESFKNMKRHLKESHDKKIDPELQDNLIPFKLQNDKFKCVDCDEIFFKFRLLVIHMSVHYSNFSCEVCGSGFMTLRLLKKHLEVHSNGNFPCDRCDKVFSTISKRALHIKGVHLKEYPRRCPLCPERFNSNYKRTTHLQDVHNQSTRVHKCETCGRAFNLKYHLLCHVKSVHLQERNHQCDVCMQRFCNKETLKRHMVIHTGEKNHKCEICGMAFLRRKNLKDHLRIHNVT